MIEIKSHRLGLLQRQSSIQRAAWSGSKDAALLLTWTPAARGRAALHAGRRQPRWRQKPTM